MTILIPTRENIWRFNSTLLRPHFLPTHISAHLTLINVFQLQPLLAGSHSSEHNQYHISCGQPSLGKLLSASCLQPFPRRMLSRRIILRRRHQHRLCAALNKHATRLTKASYIPPSTSRKLLQTMAPSAHRDNLWINFFLNMDPLSMKDGNGRTNLGSRREKALFTPSFVPSVGLTQTLVLDQQVPSF